MFASVDSITAARVKEILENGGLPNDSLSSNAASSVQVIAILANLLNIRDTEMTRFWCLFGNLVLKFVILLVHLEVKPIQIIRDIGF